MGVVVVIQGGSTQKLTLIGKAVSEKMFKIVNGLTDDGAGVYYKPVIP